VLLRLLLVTFAASIAVALILGRRLQNRPMAVRVVLALGGGLATACAIWAVIAGLVLGALFEPWPFSLRQGPDTAFSRMCYAELLGETPPGDVTRIYCRKEWGFGGDDILSIRFAYQRAATVEAIVARLQLEAVDASERDGARYVSGPAWWPEQHRLLRTRDVYRRSREFLWVDEEAMEAYYQHANF
jgi:hypothetical protein